MKNIFTITLFFFATNLLAQNTLLFEDFNDGFPVGWQTIDEDGLIPYNDPAVNFITDAWVMHEDYDTLGVNDSILISNSWHTTPGLSDDYVVLPALTLGAYGNYISFDCKSKDQSYPDDFQILYSYASLNTFTSNPKIYEATAPSYWTNYTVSLDSAGITGETIYIAFRHTSYDQFILEIDNIKVISNSPVSISNRKESTISFYPNPANDVVTINGLTKVSSYSITDLNGKLITKGVTQKNIDVSNITAGFYLLTIGEGKARKLVVK